MSTTTDSPATSDEIARDPDEAPPSLEPWLGVTLLTFVPGSLIFFLPHAILVRALVPICISMAAFLFAGFGMLIRDRRARRGAASS